MKYLVLFLMICTSTMTITAQKSEVTTVPLSKSGSIGSLSVNIKSGSITIKGTTRNDVLVNYTMIDKDDDGHEDGDKQKERAGLKKITNNSMDFVIEENDNHIEIRSNAWFKGIDLVIEVPQNFNLDINNGMGGDVNISNVNGDLNLSSYLGSVHATGVSGIVNATSYTGEIVVSFNKITPGKDMSFVNYTGNIDITLPSTFKADMKMKTGWGDIYSDLDIVTSSTKPELKKQEDNESFKLVSESWTYAKLNGGGPEFTIKSHMGSIYLRKK